MIANTVQEQREDSMGMFWLILLGVGSLMCVFVLSRWTVYRTTGRVALATAEIANYQTAITNFNKTVGRWPHSLLELKSNSTQMVFIVAPSKDPWGRPFIYVPFNSVTGFGRVITYGRDGKPGGTGLDADIERRFP
jgi:general secretion pathway protein G